MPTITLSQVVNLGAAEAFQACADIAAYPSWFASALEADKVSDGPIAQGTRFRMRAKRIGWMDIELTTFEQPTHLEFSASTGMSEMTRTVRFTPADGGTKVEQVVEARPKGVWILLTPIMGLMMRRNLQDFATALERRAASGPMTDDGA